MYNMQKGFEMRKKHLPLLVLFSFGITLSASTLLPAGEINMQGEDLTLWIALFGLGIIGILALFLSSEEIRKYKQKRAKEEEIVLKEHKTQDEIVSKISEDIYDIAKENIITSNTAGANIAKSENQLLAITTNLIDFLRIKSKKVMIDNQDFKLSNLLNDISGTLKTNTKGKEFELLYEIDSNVLNNLNSDTLNISKVLVNVLLYCIDNASTQLHLRIKRTSLYSENDQLSFTLTSDCQIDAESEIDIFRSNYNDNTEEYDSLGLFIAKELATLMKGDIIARNDENKNLEFVFSIPYSQGIQEESDTHVSSNPLEPKSILLIDSSKTSAKNMEAILVSLGHDVKIVSKDDYISYFEYFDIYDIIFLDEKLFTNKTVAKLENTNSKIISTSNLFSIREEFPNANMADIKVSKPFTVWQISDVLDKLYFDAYDTSKITKNGVVNAGTKPVHRNSFQSTRNISLNSFIKFQNNKVLLVEDNVINQKVFVGVLGKSNMQISVANHGKEALKILAQDKNYDIIFMDINMPVMDGYTATIKIRENSAYDNIPIIALSTLTSSDEIAKMFASGMNGYLPKPLQKEKLYTVFSAFINNIQDLTEKDVQEERLEVAKLDGLNLSVGVSKSSSSEIFYKEILIEFRDAYGQSDILFEKLLHDFRYEQLRILCVDLKGLTGTIGAEKLHLTITEILKKLLLKKYDFIPELVKKYTMELKLVNDSINKYLE